MFSSVSAELHNLEIFRTSLFLSVTYHEHRGYQSYLPKPIMEILGNPKAIKFIIKNRKIEVEELVDEYYKNPDKYFEANGNNTNAAPPSNGDGGAAAAAAAAPTAIAVYRTSIQPLEIKKDGVSDDYYLDAKNGGNSQQILELDVKSVQNKQGQYIKLFDLASSNNFIIFKCHYCSYQTNIEKRI